MLATRRDAGRDASFIINTRERVMVLFSIVLRYRGLNEILAGLRGGRREEGSLFKGVTAARRARRREGVRIRNSEAAVVIFHTYV